MSYSIVYSSRTGNTKMLADAIRTVLPADSCIYFGEPDNTALAAQRIYVGFWTDKGTCDEKAADFLKKLSHQEVFLFGTAGFGVNQSYFDQVLKHAGQNINQNVNLVGSYMCQGKMPLSVRERYEKMRNSSPAVPGIDEMIENFDKALPHPDSADLELLKQAVAALA